MGIESLLKLRSADITKGLRLSTDISKIVGKCFRQNVSLQCVAKVIRPGVCAYEKRTSAQSLNKLKSILAPVIILIPQFGELGQSTDSPPAVNLDQSVKTLF